MAARSFYFRSDPFAHPRRTGLRLDRLHPSSFRPREGYDLLVAAPPIDDSYRAACIGRGDAGPATATREAHSSTVA